ncbi:MAG TPA: endonuclease/exonuclease/phosphatase family protein [Desulfomonilia bacterium]
MAQIKAMTINVWSGLNYKGIFRMGSYEPSTETARRFEGLIREIKRLSPDIITVNEANPLPRYAEELASRTGYDCIWHMGVSGLRLGRFGIPINLREGDVILARKGLGLEFSGQIKLAGPGIVKPSYSIHTGDLTQALLGKITWEGEIVYVCATHWHATLGGIDALENAENLAERFSYPEKEYTRVINTIYGDIRFKMREARNTLKFIKKYVSLGNPVILMGDLNAEPDRPEIECLRLNGFSGAASGGPGFTWDPETNTNLIKYYPDNFDKKYDSLYDHLRAVYERSFRREIDYIMVNRLAHLHESRLCANEPFDGSHISDHFGVFAEIEIL